MNQLPLRSVRERHARHQDVRGERDLPWTLKHLPIAGIQAGIRAAPSTGTHLGLEHHLQETVTVANVSPEHPKKTEPNWWHGNLDPSERYWQFTARLAQQSTDSPFGWLTPRKCCFFFLSNFRNQIPVPRQIMSSSEYSIFQPQRASQSELLTIRRPS